MPKKKGDTRGPTRHPRGRALVLPRGEVPQVQQPGAARHRHPRDLPRLPRHGLGVGGKDGVYLDVDAHPRAATLDAQDRGHDGDLREVRRRRPARRADEDLPGRALLDGRPVGGLRGAARTAQPLGRAARRTRPTNIPGLYAVGEADYAVPRRQPARRQLAALLHLRAA